MNHEKAKIIAFDIESKDPNLRSLGPGTYREDGHVCGVAFAYKYEDGSIESEYVAVKHPNNSSEDFHNGWEKIAEILATDTPKVAANAMYDLDWLVNGCGIKVNGRIHDVQYAEPILDEYRKSYSLDSLAEDYLGLHKDESEMLKYCEDHGFKITKEKPVQSYLWRMPSFIVAKYAQVDAELTIKVLDKQLPKLKENDLMDIYQMEIALIPLYLRMRKVGVRVDVEKRERFIEEIAPKKNEVYRELTAMAGREINYNSGVQIASVFDSLGIEYPRKAPTDKMLAAGKKIGNPNLDKNAMANIEHPLAKKITEYKMLNYVESTVLNNTLKKSEVGGRIHCTFNPLKGEKGTVSGRYSCTNPNLQNQNSRDDAAKAYTRGIFIPEEGMAWASIDWSQIEYRMLVNYSTGPGSQDARLNYVENPDTDYHQYVMDLTGLERKPAKNCNFGFVFGMSPKTAADYFGWSLEYATKLYKTYHGKIPLVKKTMNDVGNRAKRVGYIKTILGRKARVPASKKYFVMLNRLTQGSSADIMKMSLKMAWDEGIFDILVPHITVHDEMNVSFPMTREGVEAVFRLKEIMETCINDNEKLRVPLASNLEVGFNWAELEGIQDKTQLLAWVVEKKSA